MKTKFSIYIILAAILFSACDDEFLNRVPETEIGKENFFNTEEDLQMYVYSFYNFPGHGNYVGDVATDNATTTGNTELKNIMVSSAPSSETVSGGWNWGELRNINFFLENFRNADISEEALNHYEGVARFFRARFYMHMVQRYSNVPWYDKVIEANDEEALYKTQDSRDFVVQKIFEDYDFAAQHVRESQPSGAVNRFVVLTYKMRHALYEGTFRKYHPELELQSTADTYLSMAKADALEIMQEGGYDIYNTGNPANDYHSIFVSTGIASNPEVILPRMYEIDIVNSGWWEYQFGNYEASPAKDLLQAYLMNDGSHYSAQSGYETFQFVEEFQNRDPRLYQTFAYPGWELVNTSTYSQGGGIYVQQLQKNFSGYHQIKGFVNSTDPATQEGVDFPVLRYAEVLLSYAEAAAELGELTQNDLDITINKLRDRAGMPHLSMNPAVDPVQEARYPNVKSATSQWAELLEIRRERRIEMALEGYRHDDLMRWYAGKLIEQEPQGLYFPDLGKYDLTGDGIEDIILIDVSESVPAAEDKEVNTLGVTLIYYRVGVQDSDAAVYLSNGTNGVVTTVKERGMFEEPKYYYRPVPQSQVILNPNLKQVFGWE